MSLKQSHRHYTKEQLKEINRVGRHLYRTIWLADSVASFWKKHDGISEDLTIEYTLFESSLIQLKYSIDTLYDDLISFNELLGGIDFGQFNKHEHRIEKWKTPEEHKESRLSDPAKKHLEVASVIEI